MKPLDSFSIRCYGICEIDNKILGLFEYHNDQIYCKLPGGGLEFGEGLLDCLRREFLEELNAEIEIIEHLYTQEEYIQSIFDNGKQILLVYYLVRITNLNEIKINSSDINKFEWIDLDNHCFNLPLDIVAINKFKSKIKFSN